MRQADQGGAQVDAGQSFLEPVSINGSLDAAHAQGIHNTALPSRTHTNKPGDASAVCDFSVSGTSISPSTVGDHHPAQAEPTHRKHSRRRILQRLRQVLITWSQRARSPQSPA